MWHYRPPLRDIRFVTEELLDLPAHWATLPAHAELDIATARQVIEEAGKFAADVIAPLVVRDIFNTISGLRKTGVTILLVEQNARAALEVADYGYVLEMGEVALEGTAVALAQDSRLIDTYLGAARKSAA